MDLDYFAEALFNICSHSPAAPGRSLVWTIIANPGAGGFTIRQRWKKHREILGEYRLKAQANPLRKGSCPSETARRCGSDPSHESQNHNTKYLADLGLVLTSGPGDGKKIAEAVINEAAAELSKGRDASSNTGNGAALPFYLFI